MRYIDAIHTKEYLPCNPQIRSKSTKTHYRLAIKNFCQAIGKRATIDDFRDENIARMIVLLQDLGLSSATINQRRGYLLALWRWCAKRGMVSYWPTIQRVPEPEPLPEAWTLEELRKLFAQCRREQGFFCAVPRADWWTCIHYVWWDTGERLEATLAMRWCDYNADNGLLFVPADHRKGRRKWMLYELRAPTRSAIERIRPPPRELIFPWPYHVSRLHQLYRELVQAAGLRYKPYKTGPQKMRRSFASHLAAAGGNPTEALMHSTPAVTRESYLDPRIYRPASQNHLLPDLG